jgi:hypothetical protein
MVILYVYLRIWTKKSPIYQTDMYIKKFKMVCKGKTFAHHLMNICVSVYELKKLQPEHPSLEAPLSWQADDIVHQTNTLSNPPFHVDHCNAIIWGIGCHLEYRIGWDLSTSQKTNLLSPKSLFLAARSDVKNVWDLRKNEKHHFHKQFILFLQ